MLKGREQERGAGRAVHLEATGRGSLVVAALWEVGPASTASEGMHAKRRQESLVELWRDALLGGGKP